MLTSTQATRRTCIQNHTGGIRQGYDVRARMAPSHAPPAPRAPRPATVPRGRAAMIIGPSDQPDPAPGGPSPDPAEQRKAKAKKKRKAAKKARKAAKAEAAARQAEIPAAQAPAGEADIPGPAAAPAAPFSPPEDALPSPGISPPEGATRPTTMAVPDGAVIDAPVDAGRTDGVGASAPAPAPVPAPRPDPDAPGLVARIDAVRARVHELVAVAASVESTGGSPQGAGLPDDLALPGPAAPAVAGPTAGPDDASADTGAPADPLTRPVEPIPAAIAAALTKRAPPAHGHAPTPGVAVPPGPDVAVPPDPDGRTAPAPESDAYVAASPAEEATTGRQVEPSHAATPEIDDETTRRRSGAPPAPRRPPASAVLVARELLADGMAPERVEVRLRDGYGVADPAAALALAAA